MLRKLTLFIILCLISRPSLLATVIYVDTEALGSNLGNSWVDAFSNLQDALSIAQNGDVIWVSQGKYYPTSTINRSISFVIPEGVELYGGFSGEETNLEERNWGINQTILSGNIGNVNIAMDNSYNIIFIDHLNYCKLDGFVIEEGRPYSSNLAEPLNGRTKNGGAIYLDGSGNSNYCNAVIKSCTFYRNIAVNAGGAIFLNGLNNGSTNPTIIDCIFEDNSSSDGGAVMKRGGNYENKESIIRNCHFIHNTSSFHGGAILYDQTHGNGGINIINSIFEDNWAFLAGGAVYYNDETDEGVVSIDSCQFLRNVCSKEGAGGVHMVNIDNSFSFLISNSNFIGNFTGIASQNTGLGGGLHLSYNPFIYTEPAILNLKNCNFLQNKGYNGGAIFSSKINLNFTNCNFYANEAIQRGGGVHIDLSFLVAIDFINCSFVNNSAGWYGGAFDDANLSNTPPGHILTFKNSIFQNNTAGQLGGIGGIRDVEVFFENCISDVECCEEMSEPIETSSSNQYQVVCNNSLFNSDPLFRDTANLDFTLLPCSPAINFGNNEFIDDCLFDILGNQRISDGIVDAGANESQSLSIEHLIISNVGCKGGDTGSVEFIIPQSCDPINYSWIKGIEIGEGNTDLSTGTYFFTITDSVGKIVLDTIEIIADEEVSVIAEVSPVQCENGEGGSITIIPQQGESPWVYEWSNNGIGNSQSNLQIGDYSITATDVNGCQDSVSIEITSEGSYPLGMGTSAISCHNGADGIIAIVPLGGTAPWSFNWGNGIQDSLLTEVTFGDYEVTVTDVYGCESVTSFLFENPDSLTLTTSSTDVACEEATNGTATIAVEGGSEPYDYFWENGMIEATVSDLSSGTYWITVTDNNGCSDSTSVNIALGEGFELVSSVDGVICFGEATGVAQVMPIGSSPPYSYDWGALGQDSIVTGLQAGEYEVIVSDANNCQETHLIEIFEHSEFTAEPLIQNATTSTSEDGAIGVSNIMGGTPPYSFLWSTGSEEAQLLNVSSGDYWLQITDANNCSWTDSVEVSFETSRLELPDNIREIRLFPNPIPKRSSLFLQVFSTKKMKVQIEVYDVLGKAILEKEVKLIHEQQVIELGELNNDGFFIVKISGDGWKVIKHLVCSG